MAFCLTLGPAPWTCVHRPHSVNISLEESMEQQSATGARRNEDIALDLLKFIATTTQVTKPGSASTGFVSAAAHKSEDQVGQLLDLYKRCLSAVAGK
jgi:hypothetical protein